MKTSLFFGIAVQAWGLTTVGSAVGAPMSVPEATQCVAKKIEQSPAGFQNRCAETIVLHYKDMHQAYQFAIKPGQTVNPNPMGYPYFACPQYSQGKQIIFDWGSKNCQAR